MVVARDNCAIAIVQLVERARFDKSNREAGKGETSCNRSSSSAGTKNLKRFVLVQRKKGAFASRTI